MNVTEPKTDHFIKTYFIVSSQSIPPSLLDRLKKKTETLNLNTDRLFESSCLKSSHESLTSTLSLRSFIFCKVRLQVMKTVTRVNSSPSLTISCFKIDSEPNQAPPNSQYITHQQECLVVRWGAMHSCFVGLPFEQKGIPQLFIVFYMVIKHQFLKYIQPSLSLKF